MKKRGEVCWVNFDPSVGNEIKMKRPAIIVSNNTSNKYLKRYQVLPLSTNVEKIYPSEALIDLNGKQNKAMADQLTTVSELRLINKIDSISNNELRSIETVIKLQLDLK